MQMLTCGWTDRWMKKKKRQTEEKVGKHIEEWTGWTLPAQLEQLKTEQDGKGLLLSHLWCLNNLGPVVQSIVSLTSSVNSLSVL